MISIPEDKTPALKSMIFLKIWVVWSFISWKTFNTNIWWYKTSTNESINKAKHFQLSTQILNKDQILHLPHEKIISFFIWQILKWQERQNKIFTLQSKSFEIGRFVNTKHRLKKIHICICYTELKKPIDVWLAFTEIKISRH